MPIVRLPRMSDPTGPLLGAAAIGAGGALLVQIVAGLFVARRDRTRLTFDKDVQDLETRRRQNELLFESKRLVFSRAYKLAEERYRAMSELIQTAGNETQLWHLTPAEWFSDWREARAEMILLDSTIDHDMKLVLIAFTEWANEIGFGYIENGVKHMVAIEKAMDDLAENMRSSLGTSYV